MTERDAPQSRRGFIRGAGTLAAGAWLTQRVELAAASRQVRRPAARTRLPIDNVLICCNENRTFDQYYGKAPFVGGYGIPPGYSQPGGTGGMSVPPFDTNSPVSPDPAHDWATIHGEWDQGKLDGFYTSGGIQAMSYTDASQLGYYYGLFSNFTLCVNYFCSLLGPTFPNRLYLAGATSGGQTTNSIAAGSLDWPIILDLLDAHGITWKAYNIGGACSVGAGLTSIYCDNHFQFFRRWYTDPRVNSFVDSDYYSDLASGKLPQVSFIMTNDITGEHPPYALTVGEDLQQQLIGALELSQYWGKAAYFLTYDEGGGFFDHVVPPVLDAYGAGFRVPTWVISPFAKKAHLETTLYEHSSLLKFVEHVFDLPTLASVNHQFDAATPGAPYNDAAKGGTYGPPAPPRDGRHDIGDMTECFLA
jgi:phospholipase C